MNKLPIIVIALVVLVIAIGGAVVLSKKIGGPTASTEQSTETNSVASGKSLKDLIGMTTPQECSFSDESGNSGVVYTSSGKMKGDFESVSGQGTFSTHMLVDGTTSYMWVDGQQTGFKMNFDPSQIEIPENNQANVDLNQQFDYNCKDWGGATSAFTLPAGITFTDFGQLTLPSASAAPGASTAPAVDCSVCDSVPESAKAQCRAALSCN